MAEESRSQSRQPQPGDAQVSNPDTALERLRQILFRSQIQKIEALETDLDDLERLVYDERSLVKMIAPVLGEAIRLKIDEARDEMIEALHPIIGQVVQRAVTEAVSDLARSLDAQVRSSFNWRLAWWRMRARLGGASEAQIRLRELLPFTVTDILLIHRETGLLLFHLPSKMSITSDTDLLSGMLTAIQDFSQDVLGGDGQAELGEITYGDQRILIETTQHIRLAVVVNGIAPPGFRAEMRDRSIEIEHTYAEELRRYGGDPRPLAAVKSSLSPLMEDAVPAGLSRTQKRFLAGALGMLTLCLILGCLFSTWVWGLARPAPTPLPLVVQPTSTFTVTPSPTPTSTATPTLTPTPTLTLTVTPSPTASPTASPAPVMGVIIGNVWMRAGPSLASERIGIILGGGEQVEVLSRSGDWVQVRRSTGGQAEVTGWVPERWLVTTSPLPDQLITPSSTP